MKILLVNPPVGFSYGILGISRPPLGLAYIASVLRDHHEVKIADFNVEQQTWMEYPYAAFDIVGISVDTSRAIVSSEIAQLAKTQGCCVVKIMPEL